MLAACTANVKPWCMQNRLQLKPDKLEALIVGTADHLRTVTLALFWVSVAGVELLVAGEMKAFGITLDQRLMFEKLAVAVA